MPEHRIALLVDLVAPGEEVPLALEFVIGAAARNVALPLHRDAAFDLEATASVQHDAVIMITVALVARDPAIDVGDAWSSCVPVDGSAEFRVESELPDGSVIVSGVVVHDLVLPERQEGPGPRGPGPSR